MIPTDIPFLERHFEVRFPLRYVEYLRNCPRIIQETGYDLEKWQEHLTDNIFLDETAAPARYNHDFRTWPCQDEDGNTVDARSYWLIGCDVGGNYYLIRERGSKKGSVWNGVKIRGIWE